MANYSIKVGQKFYVQSRSDFNVWNEYVATHVWADPHMLKPNRVASGAFHFWLADVYSVRQYEKIQAQTGDN